MTYEERENQNKFQAGDQVKEKALQPVDGQPQDTYTVLWVSEDGSQLLIDFGEEESASLIGASSKPSVISSRYFEIV